MSEAKENQQVRRGALAMAGGTFTSRILGMGRDIVFAAFFPLMVKDAFVVAFRLPNLFRRLLGEGSLSVSFIPVYVDQKDSQSEEQAQKLAGSVWGLLMAVTATLTGLGIVFMPDILGLLVGGDSYQSVAGKMDLTILLARVMFGYLFLVTSYAFLMGVSQSHGRFFLPAVAPALFNLVLIIAAFVPDSLVGGITGMQLAIGVLFGGVAQILLVAKPLIGQKRLPRPSLSLSQPGVPTVLKNMLPGMFGLGVVQMIGIVNVLFASHLAEGSHTYLYFADRILELPMSLIAISLGSALLPTLSAQWSRGDVQSMHQTSLSQIKLLLFLSVPCGLGMFFLSEAIVVLLFKHGHFSGDDVMVTARVIQVYSFLLLASSFVRVIVPSFYAIKNTWYPAVVSAICLLVHISAAPFLMDQFGLYGIVGSLVITGYVNALFLLGGYFKFIGRFPLVKLIQFFVKLLPGGFVMGGLLYALPGFNSLLGGNISFLSSFLDIFVTGAIVSGLYMGVAFVLGVDEAKRLTNIVTRRFKS